LGTQKVCPLCQKVAKISRGLCYPCYLERAKVERQNRNARLLGLPATFTLDQWLYALQYFHHGCAYCGTAQRILVIEHFIPLTLGGGTTATNCIPSCPDCNARKRNLHPDQVIKISHEDIERVRVFLSLQKP